MGRRKCQGCRDRDATIAALQQRLTALEAEVRELRARLGQNASNSSIPPSANPPQAPKPVVKEPTGNKPGAQPGHPPHHRLRLPPERLQHVIPLLPHQCERCGSKLPTESGPDDPPPTWHQVAELPRLAAVVTEFQGHARTCPDCGHLTREAIPQEIRAHSVGPRLTAAMSFLAGATHASKRGIDEIVETFFAVPVALGSVVNLEQEVSAALAAPHAEAQQAVQQAAVKHVDETSWKQAGKKRWLWAAATKLAACFVIYPGRCVKGLLRLLGGKLQGILCSDRWSVYGRWATERRQVCWAHLKRDFQKLVDRGGAALEYGEAGLGAVHIVFHWWHAYRGGTISREQLQDEIEPVRELVAGWLEDGASCADKPTAALCANLLALEPALWTFVYHAGVEPTNNHGERVLRTGVLWRKNSYGCHSENGCRFVERILTVVQTLRLQKRPVLDYLTDAVIAHRYSLPPPKLVPAG
jgi:transposase